MSRGTAYQRASIDLHGRGAVIELQSFRGIAALVVLVYHAGLYYDYGPASLGWMTFILNAHAAVVSFFVLSGFVLTLSLMRGAMNVERVGLFYVRRLFRIYPALWAACAVAIIYFLLFGEQGAALGSLWAQRNFAPWPLPTGKLVLALAGLKPNLPLPIWSLAVELIASMAMPVIVLALRRSTLGFVALVAALAWLSFLNLDRFVLVPVYLVDFGIGAAIALVAPAWRMAARSPAVVMLGVAGGFGLLWFGRSLTGADYELAYHQPLTAIVEGLGAALLIGTIYLRPDCFRPLAARWAIRLGDMSYSLYLLHLPVLGAIAGLGAVLIPGVIAAHPVLATIALATGTVAITVPLASWSFRTIELPMVGIGMRLTRRIEQRGRVAYRTPPRVGPAMSGR